MDNEIRYPKGFSLDDILAWGSFGLVCLDSSSSTVVKSAHDAQTQPFIDAEKRVYERFDECGGHPGLLKYYGVHDNSIRLQYAPKHDLRSYLQQNGKAIPSRQRQQWALQIAETLVFIHQAGVIHGDLTCNNILLDKELNAKIADFSGSSVDISSSPLLVHVTASHAHPVYTGSAKGDLFALGSLLFEIMTGKSPYDTLTDEEIEERYSRGEFPKIDDSLGLIGEVIRGCWKGIYDSGSMLVEHLTGACESSPLLLKLNIGG